MYIRSLSCHLLGPVNRVPSLDYQCKSVGMYKSGLSSINRHLTQTRTVSCTTPRTGKDGFLYHVPVRSGWVDFILELCDLCYDSRGTCGVDQDTRSDGSRQ